jgi:putative hydrolase of the HAD superfamily
MEFIFDLDDTLYAEIDYAHSALKFVGNLIASQFKIADAPDRLLCAFTEGQPDALGQFWETEKLPTPLKTEFLTAMREHQPDIKLHKDAKLLLNALRMKGYGFSIVTDGRSTTQRAKIAALNCLDAKFISISEEVGIEKTDTRRFLALEERLPNTHYCYIGDNPKKDFFAPNQLGWLTVLRLGNHRNIHSQEIPKTPGFAPQTSVASLEELMKLVSGP